MQCVSDSERERSTASLAVDTCPVSGVSATAAARSYSLPTATSVASLR